MQISNILNSYSFRFKKAFMPSFNRGKLTSKENEILSNDINSLNEVSLQQVNEEKLFNDFLLKKGKVTIEEYDDIVKNHPSFLIKAEKYLEKYQKSVDSNPKTIGTTAKLLKEHLDSEYDNYKLISIGTSPAAICEVMKCLGADVEFLPMTNLGNYGKHEYYDDEEREKFSNIEKAFAYLSSKGIEGENYPKDIILLDFTCTGDTLRHTKKLLSQLNNIDSDKIRIHPLIRVIHQVRENNSWDKAGLTFEDYENLYNDIAGQNVANICNVPHFGIVDISNMSSSYNSSVLALNKPNEQIFKEFDEYSKPLARAFSLCAIHEAKK